MATKKGTAEASREHKAENDQGYVLLHHGKKRIVAKPPIGKRYGSRQQKDREEQTNILRNE